MKARIASPLSSPAHALFADAAKFSPRPHGGRGAGGEGDADASQQLPTVHSQSLTPVAPSPCIPLPLKGARESRWGTPSPFFDKQNEQFGSREKCVREIRKKLYFDCFITLTPTTCCVRRVCSERLPECPSRISEGSNGNFAEHGPEVSFWQTRSRAVRCGEGGSMDPVKTSRCGLRRPGYYGFGKTLAKAPANCHAGHWSLTRPAPYIGCSGPAGRPNSGVLWSLF
jgi:hypothetical protein